MTQTVSASVPIRVARQNYYATLAIDVSGSLAQAYNSDTGTVMPDWSVAANRPTLTPRIICAASYSVVSYEWYRDGTYIGSSTGGSEDTSAYSIDSSTGALTILKNLVSAANLDPDTFECEAVIKVNGMSYTMRRGVSATLLPLSSNGYVVLVSADSTALDSSNTSTALEAEVYYGGSLVATGLTYQWYKGSDAISSATNAKYTVSRDDVDWEEYYRVIVKDSSGAVIGIGGIQITDQADNYAMEISVDSDVVSDTPATVTMQLMQRKSADSEWSKLSAAASYKAVVYDVADTDTTQIASGTLSSSGYGTFTVSESTLTGAGIESGMIRATATW